MNIKYKDIEKKLVKYKQKLVKELKTTYKTTIKNIKKIDKNTIIKYFVLFSLIKPQLFLHIKIGDIILDMCQLCAILYVLYKYYKYIYIEHHKVSNFVILIIIFSFFLIIPTLIYSGNIFSCLAMGATTTALVMYTELLMDDSIDKMFKSYINLFDAYIIINSIFIILFPHGLNNTTLHEVYFLGIDNRFIFYYLPAILFHFCYSYLKYDKLRKIDITIYIVALVTLIYRWSVAAALGLLLYIPFFLIIINRSWPWIDKVCNIFTYIGTMLVANIAIIILKIQNLFKWLIVDILHKDLTFSARTTIWEKVLPWIYKRPIIGNGYEYLETTLAKSNGANHPHNYMLTLLYRGGIIYFCLFLSLLVISGYKMMNYNYHKVTKTIAFTIFVVLFLSLMDSFDFAIFFVIIQMGYNIEKILTNNYKMKIKTV